MSNDTKALIERLRAAGLSLPGSRECGLAGNVCDEAAEVIARLEAERDEARQEAMKECYQVVGGEALDDPQAGTSDEAYEAAIGHALGAIRAAMQAKP